MDLSLIFALIGKMFRAYASNDESHFSFTLNDGQPR